MGYGVADVIPVDMPIVATTPPKAFVDLLVAGTSPAIAVTRRNIWTINSAQSVLSGTSITHRTSIQ